MLAVPGLSLAQTSGTGLRAGAANVDITTDSTNSRLRRTSSGTTRNHLYARAILVDDGRSCAAIVGIDSGGSRDGVVDAAIAKSSASTVRRADGLKRVAGLRAGHQGGSARMRRSK